MMNNIITIKNTLSILIRNKIFKKILRIMVLELAADQQVLVQLEAVVVVVERLH